MAARRNRICVKMAKEKLLFSGSSHKNLAAEICRDSQIPLGNIHLGTFPDQEISVEILEDVQGKEVYVLQSLALDPQKYLLELLLIVDALKRADAQKIAAIIPYYSYCRQDRRHKPGVPITAKLIANLLATAGVTHLMTFDLHADQIEGFFDIPLTHLHCGDLLAKQAEKHGKTNTIVVAPDIGSIKIAKQIAKSMHLDLAIIKKERLSSVEVKTTLMGDVADKNVFLVDDLCSTGETIAAAAHLCKEMGALNIIAGATHGLFVKDAVKKIESSPIATFFVTNTICQQNRLESTKKIHTISISKMIAEQIAKT